MQQSKFISKQPYLFTALIVLAMTVIYIASGAAVTILKLPTFDLYIIANVSLAILGIVLLTRLQLWKEVGFRAFAVPSDLRLYWLPLFPALINLSFGIDQISILQFAMFFVVAGLIGFVEEVFFRGLILRAIAPLGLWRAAIISSVIFGVAHSLNILSGANPISTLLQIGYALAIGFAFVAVTLRTGVIWPLVIIHALIDFAAFIAAGKTDSSATVSTSSIMMSVIYIVTFTVYGVFMMQFGQVKPLSRTKAAL